MSSSVSHSSLLDLKALTAEHAARLDAEGRAAVRGAPRSSAAAGPSKLSRDPFLRPSPGLVARLAREARADAQQRRVFQDEGSGVDDATRREILEAKARRYDALARGDLSGLSERERRELDEAAVDFEAKARGGDWSDHSSDVDESAVVPEDAFDTLADTDEVEYIDELGRTRHGTRRDARDAERAASSSRRGRDRDGDNDDPHAGSSYAQVLDSQLIHGDQSFFPVYTPDPDALRRKYQEEERLRAAEHYDSTREVRVRGAGAYQFAMGGDERRAQRASLDAARAETERARREGRVGEEGERGGGGGLSKAQAARRRRLAERAAVVEAKRVKLLGGAGKVAAARAARTEREAETLLGSVSVALEGDTDTQ